MSNPITHIVSDVARAAIASASPDEAARARNPRRDATMDSEGVEISGGAYGGRALSDADDSVSADSVQYELFSGISNFPPVLQESAKELMKDANDWARPLMKTIAERNRIRGRYSGGSMLDAGCWRFNACANEILLLYTGELFFDGAEPSGKNDKRAKDRMKAQGILTQSEMSDLDMKSNTTCYGFNLEDMVKLKAEDGNIYDVRLYVSACHEYKNSETPAGKGRLQVCGGLINHACLGATAQFVVISVDKLLSDQEECQLRKGNPQFMTTKSNDPDASELSNTSDYESDKDCAKDGKQNEGESCNDVSGADGSGKVKKLRTNESASDDEDLEEAHEFNTYEVLCANDLIKHFIDSEVYDVNGNYLPSMLTMIMSIRHCHMDIELTIDYGFISFAQKFSKQAPYDQNAFWKPLPSVKASFRNEMKKDSSFGDMYQVLRCQCHANACKEDKEKSNTAKEKFDEDEIDDLREFGFIESGIMHECPANVARIAPRETQTEKQQRDLNENYLFRFTDKNDREKLTRNEETVQFLIKIDLDRGTVRSGPLLAHHGYPIEFKATLDTILREANKRLQPLLDMMKHSHGYFRIGAHQSHLPRLVQFNGKEEIPEGTLLNITVGVLMPNAFIPPKILPNSFCLNKWIVGFKSSIVLLHCNPTPGDYTGLQWASVGAFTHGCNANIHLMHGADKFEVLNDYLPGDLMGNLREPLVEDMDLCVQDLIGIGISMECIPPHRQLNICKELYSEITNPIYKGLQVHDSIFVEGTALQRCICIFPLKCPTWSFELISLCLNKQKADSQKLIEKDTFKNVVGSLNPHTMSRSITGFALTEDDKKLCSRLKLLTEQKKPTYMVNDNSCFSPNYEEYVKKPDDPMAIIRSRQEVSLVGSMEAEKLHGPDVKAAPRRLIIPLVRRDTDFTEDPNPPDDVERNIDDDDVVSGLNHETESDSDEKISDEEASLLPQSATKASESHVQAETPDTGKHRRNEKKSPPDAPVRKVSNTLNDDDDDVICMGDSPPPHSRTPPRPSGAEKTATEDFVDLVDSPDVVQIDEAGPVATIDDGGLDLESKAAYLSNSSSGEYNSDHSQPMSPSDFILQYRKEHGEEDQGQGQSDRNLDHSQSQVQIQDQDQGRNNETESEDSDDTGAAEGGPAMSAVTQRKSRKPSGERSQSGKTKKMLIEEYVAKALDITTRNNADFDKFKKVLQNAQAELTAAETEMECILGIVGIEGVRDRALLRKKIEGFKEKIAELLIKKEQFVSAILSVGEYTRSKNSFKPMNAREIELLLNELPKYRFVPHIPDDGAARD